MGAYTAIKRGRVHRGRNTGSAPRPQWREQGAGTSIGERPRPQWGGAAGTAKGGRGRDRKGGARAGTAPPLDPPLKLKSNYDNHEIKLLCTIISSNMRYYIFTIKIIIDNEKLSIDITLRYIITVPCYCNSLPKHLFYNILLLWFS